MVLHLDITQKTFDDQTYKSALKSLGLFHLDSLPDWVDKESFAVARIVRCQYKISYLDVIDEDTDNAFSDPIYLRPNCIEGAIESMVNQVRSLYPFVSLFDLSCGHLNIEIHIHYAYDLFDIPKTNSVEMDFCLIEIRYLEDREWRFINDSVYGDFGLKDEIMNSLFWDEDINAFVVPEHIKRLVRNSLSNIRIRNNQTTENIGGGGDLASLPAEVVDIIGNSIPDWKTIIRLRSINRRFRSILSDKNIDLIARNICHKHGIKMPLSYRPMDWNSFFMGIEIPWHCVVRSDNRKDFIPIKFWYTSKKIFIKNPLDYINLDLLKSWVKVDLTVTGPYFDLVEHQKEIAYNHIWSRRIEFIKLPLTHSRDMSIGCYVKTTSYQFNDIIYIRRHFPKDLEGLFKYITELYAKMPRLDVRDYYRAI